VSRGEANAWCAARGFTFAGTSAKTGEGIVDVFDELITQLCAAELQVGVRTTALKKSTKDGGCC
jgi:hypothetical protein